jgi:hypothetical protein
LIFWYANYFDDFFLEGINVWIYLFGM